MTTVDQKRRRGIAKWWAKGAPERGDWHWLVILGAIVVGLLAAGIALVLVLAHEIQGGGNDWSGRLFTYRDGRLDVDIGNTFLLAGVLGLAYRFGKHGTDT